MALNNGGDTVELVNGAREVVDSVTYSGGQEGQPLAYLPFSSTTACPLVAQSIPDAQKRNGCCLDLLRTENSAGRRCIPVYSRSDTSHQ